MRNVRNWWITTRVDGRRTTDATGPQGKHGGFEIVVRQRDDGESVEALRVQGYIEPDGRLRLVVRNERGDAVHEFVTER